MPASREKEITQYILDNPGKLQVNMLKSYIQLILLQQNT